MVTCATGGLLQPLTEVKETVGLPVAIKTVAPLVYCEGRLSTCHLAPAVTTAGGKMLTCRLPARAVQTRLNAAQHGQRDQQILENKIPG